MPARYACSRYPSLRVHRGDRTYIEFDKGIYDAYDPRDEALLDSLDMIARVSDLYDVGPGVKRPTLEERTVNWFSPIYGTADGYGNSAERMILALERAGYYVVTDPGAQRTGKQTFIQHIFDRGQRAGAVRLAYCPPNARVWRPRYPGQALVGFSMWEDSVLPKSWLDGLVSANVIAAPSTFCVDLFRAALEELRLDIPVVLVPLGVDSDLFPYRRRVFRKGTDTFVVLHSATLGSDPRKGALDAVKAFQTAFAGDEKVKLILRARLGPISVDDPRIEQRTGIITEEEKAAILHEAHALLYPSCGEGFGLIPLEAISSGLPSIVTDCTAMSDYKDLFTPVAWDYEPSQITLQNQPRSPGEWCRPRLDDLVRALRMIYDRYPQATTFAAKAAKTARATWTYDRSARALIEAFDLAIARNKAPAVA